MRKKREAMCREIHDRVCIGSARAGVSRRPVRRLPPRPPRMRAFRHRPENPSRRLQNDALGRIPAQAKAPPAYLLPPLPPPSPLPARLPLPRLDALALALELESSTPGRRIDGRKVRIKASNGEQTVADDLIPRLEMDLPSGDEDVRLEMDAKVAAEGKREFFLSRCAAAGSRRRA